MAKILINISDEILETLKAMAEVGLGTCEDAIVNGTVLPDEATNGDVIKALFPSAWDKDRSNEEWDEWWNSPYKEVKDGTNN